MRRSAILLSLLANAVAASGCGSDPATRASGRLGEAKEVRVARAERGVLPNVVTVSGTLAAEDQVVLGMKVSGRVVEFSADLGSRVEQGQAMVRLDPTDFRLRVQQAEAALQSMAGHTARQLQNNQGEQEQGHEHQDNDEGGKDNGAADFHAGAVDDFQHG